MTRIDENLRFKHRENRERTRQAILEAIADLTRERSFNELSVGDVMDRAGIGRTVFYRHFEDLSDLLLNAGREPLEELFAVQTNLAATRADVEVDTIREAVRPTVDIYQRHGPLLRALNEAAAADERLRETSLPIRDRFDEMVSDALRRAGKETGRPFTDTLETAHALNLLTEGYLLDAFGLGARVEPEVAVRTLTEIWSRLFDR